MPLVNLIAEQRAVKRQAIRKTRAFMCAWVFSLVAGLGAIAALVWQADLQSERLAELRAKSVGMQPYHAAIEDANRELAVLRPKLTTLQVASTTTAVWHRILYHVATRFPEGGWLTAIRAQEPKSENQPFEIRFTGVARDQTLVGEVMQRLNECADLKSIELKYTREKTTGTDSGVEFEIIAHLLQPKPTEAKEAKNSDDT